jgi:predicted metalloprotease with PDZ domain
MRRLNQDFARRGRFYTMADFRSIISQLAPAFDLNEFWADDVQGTRELDYSTYFGYAGLELAAHTTDRPVPGFSASRNAGGLLQVDSVDPESAAERAGLLPGDVLMMANGDLLPAGADAAPPLWRPGQALELQIARQGETHVLKFRIGASQEVSIQIREDPQARPEQLHVREGWLTGVTDSAPEKP